jgi:ribosomal protein RSM22 (predicted rRNA methylase)
LQLPPDLRGALEDVLRETRASQLKTNAADISRRYRTPRQPNLPLLRSAEDVAAYLAVRLPATYAAVRHALRETLAAVADDWPTTQLDVGAGPGTAAWAAAATWSSLGAITFVERDPEMISLGRRLAAGASAGPLRKARWLCEDLRRLPPPAPHDLVTAAYVLGELDVAVQDRLVAQLWQASRGLLVLVEPGTSGGFARIRRARAQLLGLGAQVAAPCPHDVECPMADGDWCHFAQRLERSRLHRRSKGAELGHEDEKFSYVAASRWPVRRPEGRVLRHPQVRQGHVRLEVCGPDGLRSEVVARSDGRRYRMAKDLAWGEAMPAPGSEGEEPS